MRVRAPAAEGAANEALCRLLAAELGIPRSEVSITGGATARTKRLLVGGGSAVQLAARWPGVRAG